MQISVGEIAKALGATALGASDYLVSGPAEPKDANETQLALAMNSSYSDALIAGNAKAAILWDGADWEGLGLVAAIYVPRPRSALAGIGQLFGNPPEIPKGIHPSAAIAADVEIGEGAAIGPFVSIGRGARIGANARILSHCSIAEDANIGDDCLFHSGSRIGARVEIGNGFIAQPNAAIGNDGFSFVTPEAGAIEEARNMSQPTKTDKSLKFDRINSLGTVIIGEDVEIGANSTIDRGTIANTIIGDGTKIDNLVQVGHNVRIGKNCLLCGMVGVAGSVEIGDSVILAGQVGVVDHVTIGNNVVVSAMSGVTSNIPANRMMMGNPAVKLETSIASYKAVRRLPRLAKKIEELQKLVSKLGVNE